MLSKKNENCSNTGNYFQAVGPSGSPNGIWLLMGTLQSLHRGLENTFVNFKWIPNLPTENICFYQCCDFLIILVDRKSLLGMYHETVRSNPWCNCANFWSENAANIRKKILGSILPRDILRFMAWGCWEWGRGDADGDFGVFGQIQCKI